MRTFAFLLIIAIQLFTPQYLLPVTGSTTPAKIQSPAQIPQLSEFSASISNGDANQLVGVYIPDLIAFPVIQQPAGKDAFVSTDDNVVTQFRMAADYGSIGLLAHNDLAGRYFDQAALNQVVVLVYGDGSTRYYHIYAMESYQALSPNDPAGAMKNLADLNNYSVEQVFYRTYGLGNETLVLQTCIAQGDEQSWGRLFLLAHPLEKEDPLLINSLNFSFQNLQRAFRPTSVSTISN